MNNGTEGTPNHHCSSGFCFGDYPQLGFDANGMYVTTNEFDFFNGEFHGAQLYAFSKADLVAGDATPTSATIQNIYSPAVGDSAYTLQPVISRPADFVGATVARSTSACRSRPWSTRTRQGSRCGG